MEGGGPLIFSSYELVSTLTHDAVIDAFPNVEGMSRRHADGNIAVYNQLAAKAKAFITPGLRFYQRKFSQEFHGLVRAFKSARLCCPILVQELHPTAGSLQEPRNFG